MRKLVWTARRYRTIEIHAVEHTITAAGPPPTGLRHAIETITTSSAFATSSGGRAYQ